MEAVEEVAEREKRARFAGPLGSFRDELEKPGEGIVLCKGLVAGETNRPCRDPPAMWKSLTTTKRRCGGGGVIQARVGQKRSKPTFMSPWATPTPRRDSVRRTCHPKAKPTVVRKTTYTAGPTDR